MSDSINYTDKENLQVVFSYLIFNIESINKKYGRLSSFLKDFDISGETNGKLYITAEMNYPHYYLAKLVDERVRFTRLKEREDYVFGIEHLTIGVNHSVTSLINREIPEFKEIKWLGSIITHKGNYVWHVNNINQKKKNYLTFQENQLEGEPPIKYYQQLLIKYFECCNPGILSFKPKAYEVDNHYVYFETKKYSGKNGVSRRTLGRFQAKDL